MDKITTVGVGALGRLSDGGVLRRYLRELVRCGEGGTAVAVLVVGPSGRGRRIAGPKLGTGLVKITGFLDSF